MKKTAIYYGSTTGTCENIAMQIAEALGLSDKDVHNVTTMTPAEVEKNDVLILGSSTWGCGDLQDDWYDGIEQLKKANLTDKQVALFSCGDADCYGDTFCEAMARIHEAIADSRCSFIGKTSTDGYNFTGSEAVTDGYFIGLAIDDINESHLTADRIASWAEQLKAFIY